MLPRSMTFITGAWSSQSFRWFMVFAAVSLLALCSAREVEASPPGLRPVVLLKRPSIRGSLSRRVIQRTTRSYRHHLTSCYQRLLRRHPAATGRLEVRWIIQPTGKVRSIRIRKNSLGSSRFARCIRRKLHQWRYPNPPGGGIVVVEYTFLFRKSAAKKRRSVRVPTARPGRGSLTRRQILAVVRSEVKGLQRCYRQMLHPGMPLQHKVMIAWTVLADGTTENIRVIHSSLQHKIFHKCLEQQVATWKFPRPLGGRIVRIRFPFIFRR